MGSYRHPKCSYTSEELDQPQFRCANDDNLRGTQRRKFAFAQSEKPAGPVQIEKLKESLTRAERNVAFGREAIARQSALLSKLEQGGRDTTTAESVLRTLQDSQRLQQDYIDRLTEEFKTAAPDEWKERQRGAEAAYRSNVGNRLLNSLSFEDLASLQPLLRTVELRRRSHLQFINRKMTSVLFPESGAISVIQVTGVGHNRTQVGIIGRGGMTGVGLLFGWWKSPFEMEVAVEGQAQSIEAEDFTDFVSRSRNAGSIFLQSRFALLLQFAAIAAANAQGTVEQRLAHLLLILEEQLESATIPLTHEQLADMMTVRRASVTVTLEQFHSDHLIALERGVIAILDPDGLEGRAADLKAPSIWAHLKKDCLQLPSAPTWRESNEASNR